MKSKSFLLLSMFILSSVFQQTAFSQVNCEGEKILTEKRCAGDEISSQEKDLYRMVNEYRAQNNLPQIPISESLSLVANRHLLDMTLNLKSFSHGWSNCAYDVNNEKTWNCVFESPKRLNSGYDGKGYENLYRTKTGNANAALVLEAWKKSDLHNSLLLNLKAFKDIKFDAFGVAINGQYAALWFGSKANAAQTVKNSASSTERGITLEKALANMDDVFPFEKSSATFVNEQFTAPSADKSMTLRLKGKRDDISEATISVKPEKNKQPSQKQKDIFGVFLNNAAPEWSEKENWLNTSLIKIRLNPQVPQTIIFGKKVFVLSVDSQNNLSLGVKVNKKPTAVQLN